MKKLKLLMLVVMVAIMTTGCGKEEKLDCSITQSQAGVKMEQNIKMQFKDKKVNKITMILDAKADNDIIKQGWSEFSKTLENTYKDPNQEGIKITTNNNEKDYVFNITIDIDLEKASEENLKAYNLDGIADKKSNIEDVKKNAENSGYSCK